MTGVISGRAVGRCVAMAAVGVVLGLVGTAAHRWLVPWGLVLALACVLSAAVLARAWTGWVGMLVLALFLASTVGVLALTGPGGDVLVAAQPVGYVWYGGAAVVALAGLAPARWFSDRPAGRTRV